jgi:hypothetical protein
VGAFFLWKRYFADRHHRLKQFPTAPEHLYPALPNLQHPDIQRIESGHGLLFHRRYLLEVKPVHHPLRYTPEELITYIQGHLNDFSPPELAIFEKVHGAKARFCPGDIFHIHISGPWDGPVIVGSVTPTAFSFITLKGHLEAGYIYFSARIPEQENDTLCFQIESWSRSKDAAVDLVYDQLKIAQVAQSSMWTLFCQNVADVLEGETTKDIEVLTETFEWKQSP